MKYPPVPLNRPAAFAVLSCLSILPSIAQDLNVAGKLDVTQGTKLGTSSASGSVEVRLGGQIFGKGTFNVSPALLTTDQGAGTRMLWHPRKAAFRAGTVTGTQWDEGNIGPYSAAFGLNSQATGTGSVAMGNSSAIGEYSIAMGDASYANWTSSIAFGKNAYSTGYNSVAIGGSAIAINWANIAIGEGTFSGGGEGSVALGYYCESFSDGALALGTYSTANAIFSTAMGYSTTADAYMSTAIGSRNVGGGNPFTWVSTDPLFEIGNAPVGQTTRSNAVTVYKNGSMEVQGSITCAPGGDVPMFGE